MLRLWMSEDKDDRERQRGGGRQTDGRTVEILEAAAMWLVPKIKITARKLQETPTTVGDGGKEDAPLS